MNAHCLDVLVRLSDGRMILSDYILRMGSPSINKCSSVSLTVDVKTVGPNIITVGPNIQHYVRKI